MRHARIILDGRELDITIDANDRITTSAGEALDVALDSDQIANPGTLSVSISVNGEQKSAFELANMERSVAELISTISRIMTLQPGEIIAVGFAGDRVAVAKGDKIEASIEGVGTLNNTLGGA